MFTRKTSLFATISLSTMVLFTSGCGKNSAKPLAHPIPVEKTVLAVVQQTHITHLNMLNQQMVLFPGINHSLTVYAYFDDNSKKNISSLATYQSNQPQWITVSNDGMVHVSEHTPIGTTATIQITYEGQAMQCIITVKYDLQRSIQVNGDGLAVVTNPISTAVIVNKKRNLPSTYIPNHLIFPNVTFSHPGHIEKNEMREVAAHALEKLFQAAQQDGIQLNAVSGYRSYITQQNLFNYYVKVQGLEQAKRFSAHPGQSEHQTGLAMDVSSPDYKDQLEQGFGDTPAGKWLKAHAADYGFIIRYPKGKESITGYAYEPWHIRYVGKTIAHTIMSKAITLEEYFQNAIPVNN